MLFEILARIRDYWMKNISFYSARIMPKTTTRLYVCFLILQKNNPITLSGYRICLCLSQQTTDDKSKLLF